GRAGRRCLRSCLEERPARRIARRSRVRHHRRQSSVGGDTNACARLVGEGDQRMADRCRGSCSLSPPVSETVVAQVFRPAVTITIDPCASTFPRLWVLCYSARSPDPCGTRFPL